MLAVETYADNATASYLLKGRYLLQEVIGEGQYGRVYRAWDTENYSRQVVVKQMKQGEASDEYSVACTQFRQEARMLSGLCHPGIPSLLDTFELYSCRYLVMDFVAGETLYAKLDRESALPCGEALSIARDVCSVLDYLHSLRIPVLHRDLKPANVLLGTDGRLSLLDFGISCPIRRVSPPGIITSGYGTSGYAPPEQYHAGRLTPRSDLYSLGVIMHQMLSGEHPIYPSLFHFVPLAQDIPQEVAALVFSLLQLYPANRPGRTAAVRARLAYLAAKYADVAE